MRALSKETFFDFMGQRRVAGLLSILLVGIALGSIATRGLHFGIDFTGGVLVEVGYSSPVSLDAVRNVLATDHPGAIVQHFGSSSDVLIRLPPSAATNADVGTSIQRQLESMDNPAQLRRVEFVGPQVGEDLTIDGGLALLFTLMAIFIYVLLRFHWRLSAGAVAALAHDVTIVVGAFSLFGIDFDLTVLAALLAVIGYSLNDTIVVFDRFRENFRRKAGGDVLAVMNASINQTLSRTLMTSGTTLLVLVSLYTVGGEALSGFSLALIIGICVGTYSSIYVAGSAAVALGLKRQDLVLPDIQPLDDSGAQL